MVLGSSSSKLFNANQLLLYEFRYFVSELTCASVPAAVSIVKCDEDCVDDTMRLNDGDTVFEGVLEICIDNEWELFCANDHEDDAGMCQELGFSPLGGEERKS